MKQLSIIEQPSKELVEIMLQKYGLSLADMKTTTYPQEDYLASSQKYPIFVVADGVTLIQYLIEKRQYPNPSPAGEIARIFCEELIKSAEARYKSFKESDIKDIFKEANVAARKFNQRLGRTPDTVDYWDNDYYAATAAFVVIKDNVVYWGSICDSYIMRFNREGKLIFKSPDCHTKANAEAPKFIGDSNNPKEKAQYYWSKKRNSINSDDKLVGYGVVTGEELANRYLSFGSFEIGQGDLIFILTDGFENYMQLPEFISLFVNWDSDTELRLKELIAIKAKDNPDEFGHERSLIVVST